MLVCDAAPHWLTLLGCSEYLRPHHNFFAVDSGGYALTHLRLGVRGPLAVSPASSPQSPISPFSATSSYPRTAVLRLRVYGQVALGAPHSGVGTLGVPRESQHHQWPPKVLQDVTNVLHGAAVVLGPSSGVWTPQNRQELLLPRGSVERGRRSW